MSGQVALTETHGLALADSIDRYLAARDALCAAPQRLALRWDQIAGLENLGLLDWTREPGQVFDCLDQPHYRGVRVVMQG